MKGRCAGLPTFQARDVRDAPLLRRTRNRCSGNAGILAELDRDDAGGRHTPIIAITGNVIQGNRQKAIEAGMDDYVSKPIGLGESKVLRR